MSEHSDLRQKIEEAKRRLSLPELLSRLGLSDHAKKTARCPFPDHEDKHPSFSVFKGEDGFWHWKCQSRCGDGDEIRFLSKLKGLSLTQAMSSYLDMAGFPASRPSKSREYPKCLASPVSPECPVSLVYPVSNGQGLNKQQENMLKTFGSCNRCTERAAAKKKLWKLMRDLKAVEKGIGQELPIAGRLVAFDEWYRLSQACLDPEKTYEDYLAEFLAGLGKVRVPTREGDKLNKALTAVAKLSLSELPVIPGLPNASESWRRVAGLHRELSRLCEDKAYFLTCRDAAKASPGLSYQTAYNMNLALASGQLGVIMIVNKGKKGVNSRKAAEFRYLLSKSSNGQAEIVV